MAEHDTGVEEAWLLAVRLFSWGLSSATVLVTLPVDVICVALWILYTAAACIARADRSEGEGRVGLVGVVEVLAFATVLLSVVHVDDTETELEELVWVERVGRWEEVGRWDEVGRWEELVL